MGKGNAHGILQAQRRIQRDGHITLHQSGLRVPGHKKLQSEARFLPATNAFVVSLSRKTERPDGE
jgi:hypothetical protein